MCKCTDKIIKDITDRLTTGTSLDAFKPKHGTFRRVVFKSTVLNLNTGRTELGLPFEMVWDMPNGRTKRHFISVNASYCPFCGKKLTQGRKP